MTSSGSISSKTANALDVTNIGAGSTTVTISDTMTEPRTPSPFEKKKNMPYQCGDWRGVP